MYNKLIELIKKTKGNVLTIGLDDKLISAFDKNNNVNLYSISSKKSTFKDKLLKKHKMKTNKGKNINIKKLRRTLNKKSTDYLICNFDCIKDYYKYVIKDTVYINNNIIYIYSNIKENKDFLIERYSRYNVKIEVTDYKDGFLLTIDNKNSKNSYFKDKLYFIKDTMYNLTDFISNILIS